MSVLPGIGGSLFPVRYLTDAITSDLEVDPDRDTIEKRRRQLMAWWTRVGDRCGPATGLRAIVDLVAMPLTGALGFRAREIRFERGRARVLLTTPASTPVGLIVHPWAARRPITWRDAIVTAHDAGAEWCFVLAPPFLSLVVARGHASRHSVDFTLPAALAGGSFERFWMVCRAAAFERATAQKSFGRCIRLDDLVAAASTFQDAVRTDLQDGVVGALRALAPVLRAPDASQDSIDSEALTIVYRILFLLFAESRHLVPVQHPIYGGSYSIASFCRAALGPTAGAGVWEGLAAVTRLSRTGCRTDDLIVRPFNGRLFARAAAPTLEQRRTASRPSRRSAIRDGALQRALVALGSRPGPHGRETINFADLGVEQLGAVYERVLDIDELDAPPASGHSAKRKQTGTFYTPQSLAEFVVRRTLAPLVRGATSDGILSLRVVDPAMGSGAFLVAACRYLADAYERALVDEGRIAETDLGDEERADHRRLVAERCLAGVDANPVAVQLARLSLWLTSLSHGKPLGFLDHRLRVGNSLVGISPDDLARTGWGTRKTAAVDLPLFPDAALEHTMRRLARPLADLVNRRDDSIEAVRAKEGIWHQLIASDSPLEPWRLAAHLWCARWFCEGSPLSSAELRAAIDGVLKGDTTLGRSRLEGHLAAARRLGAEHGFFHWPLEFADVFYDDDGRARRRPGFDAVIGNPPWEMLRNDHEGAANRQLVRFIRESGLYPSCDRGHLNLYQPFVERALAIARAGGRVGLVLPWGLASDDGAARLRSRLFLQSTTDTVVGLDNARVLFPIHRGLRFLVVVTSPGGETSEVRARFGVRSAAELDDLPGRDDPLGETAYPIRLTSTSLRIMGGETRRIPDARDEWSLRFLDHVTRRFPALGSPEGWSARFSRELNATDDRDRLGASGLPIVEGKHLSPFRVDLAAVGLRIERTRAAEALPDRRFERARLAYRDVSGVGNKLTLIASVIPADVVTTHTVFCLRTAAPLDQQHFLSGLFNSYVLNAVVRLLMGSHVTTGLVEGLPVPAWTASPIQRRIAKLGFRLSQSPDSPRAEAALQAAVAVLYGIDVENFTRLLHTFPLVSEASRERARARLLRYSP
jgi:Eco57I restriction-modification methylase